LIDVDVRIEHGKDKVSRDAGRTGGGIELVKEAGRESVYGVSENRPQSGDEAGSSKAGFGQVEEQEILERGWGVIVDER
jgi:hypothetical protein